MKTARRKPRRPALAASPATAGSEELCAPRSLSSDHSVAGIVSSLCRPQPGQVPSARSVPPALPLAGIVPRK